MALARQGNSSAWKEEKKKEKPQETETTTTDKESYQWMMEEIAGICTPKTERAAVFLILQHNVAFHSCGWVNYHSIISLSKNKHERGVITCNNSHITDVALLIVTAPLCAVGLFESTQWLNRSTSVEKPLKSHQTSVTDILKGPSGFLSAFTTKTYQDFLLRVQNSLTSKCIWGINGSPQVSTVVLRFCTRYHFDE